MNITIRYRGAEIDEGGPTFDGCICGKDYSLYETSQIVLFRDKFNDGAEEEIVLTCVMGGSAGIEFEGDGLCRHND